VFTPYLHFPGAFTTFDELTGTLFSSDLFGGFTNDDELVAADMSYFEDIRPFHEHYMPSREILAHGMEDLETLPLELIAPQHGKIIPKPLIAGDRSLEAARPTLPDGAPRHRHPQAVLHERAAAPGDAPDGGLTRLPRGGRRARGVGIGRVADPGSGLLCVDGLERGARVQAGEPLPRCPDSAAGSVSATVAPGALLVPALVTVT
jgi:hypothetical protein